MRCVGQARCCHVVFAYIYTSITHPAAPFAAVCVICSGSEYVTVRHMCWTPPSPHSCFMVHITQPVLTVLARPVSWYTYMRTHVCPSCTVNGSAWKLTFTVRTYIVCLCICNVAYVCMYVCVCSSVWCELWGSEMSNFTLAIVILVSR